MKQGSALAAALALLLGTVGLLAGTREALSPARGQAVSAWLSRTQLGDMAKAPAETTLVQIAGTANPSEGSEWESAENAVPQMVPVTEVQEAWDEEARKTEALPPAPSPVTVEGDISLEIRNETDYPVEFSELPALPAGMDFRTAEPVILLMHTHGSESYADPDNPGYRTSDPEKSVLAVAEAMGAVLEQRGYGTVHDTTICDEPEFSGAYNRSRQVIQENLAAYPSIQLVLDVHRDAVEDENGEQIRMACRLGEDTAAQLMLVVGTDAGGLEHPNWQENLSLAAVLQARLTRDYPDLMRPINLRTERFNQDLAPLDLLVEVGSSGDTLEEAIRSAQVFAGALADVLDQYSGKSS